MQVCKKLDEGLYSSFSNACRNKETGGQGLVPSVCLKKDDGEGTCSLEPLEERCDESEENELTEGKG